MGKFFSWRNRFTPLFLVVTRFYKGRLPDAVFFAWRHNLNYEEVHNLFSGETISFSLKMCKALAADTDMSETFFRNLSNRWPPSPPPAHSMALLGGPLLFVMRIYEFKCSLCWMQYATREYDLKRRIWYTPV